MNEGFIAIDNDIFDSIWKLDLSGSEFRVLGCIVKHTIGFHRDECSLSVSYISAYTDVPTRNVQRALKSLAEKELIVTCGTQKRVNLSKIIVNKTTNLSQETTEMSRQNCRTDDKIVAETTKLSQKTTKMSPKKDNLKKTIERERDTPSLEEVTAYFLEHGFSEAVAKKFFDYREGLDWMCGRNKIKKWRNFADKWMIEERDFVPKPSSPTFPEGETDIWGKPIKPDWE